MLLFRAHNAKKSNEVVENFYIKFINKKKIIKKKKAKKETKKKQPSHRNAATHAKHKADVVHT